MSDKVIINAEIKGNVGEVSKEIQEASNSADKLQKNTKMPYKASLCQNKLTQEVN